MKAIRIILGILSIILSAVCFVSPFESEIIYGYLVAIYVGVIGIMTIICFIVERKKKRLSGLEGALGGVALAFAILAVMFMFFNIRIPGFTFRWITFCAVFFLVSMTVEGISLFVRGIVRPYPVGMKIFMIVFGLLMLSASSTGYFMIPTVISMFGIFTAIGFLSTGIQLISTSFFFENEPQE